MNTYRLRVAFSSLLLLLWQSVQAQPYTRDTVFSLQFDFFGLGSGGKVNGIIHLPNGKLLPYGSFRQNTDVDRAGIVRFFPNGQLDPVFLAPSSLTQEEAGTVVSTDYGYWVYQSPNAVFKMTLDGQKIDPDYTNNMLADIGLCNRSRPVMLHDGSALMGGGWCAYPPWVNSDRILFMMRILPNGKVDTTFQHNANESAIFMQRYDNSRIMIAGSFTEYDSVPRFHIARIDTLGNLDTTFNSIFTDGLVYPAHIQPDGKIIITGQFTIQGHPETLGMVRLHTDGSLDSTFNNFNTVDPVYGSITTVCPTSNGGFLVGGEFTAYQGVARGRIVKLDANGFLEPQYFTGTGIDAQPPAAITSPPYVTSITRGPNDQYYVTGWFAGFNGDTVQPIIRLNGPQTVGIEPAIAKKAAVTVQPNPAKEHTTLSWELPLLEGTAILVVTDVNGREVARQSIGSKQGQWVWDTRSAKAGMYFYQLLQNGQQLTSGKVAVVK